MNNRKLILCLAACIIFPIGAITSCHKVVSIATQDTTQPIKNELSLVFTVCFKDECREYIAETYQANEIDLCKVEGRQLELDNGTVWACIPSKQVLSSYQPKPVPKG